MKYYRFPENKITKLLLGAFLLVLLLLGRDTQYTLYLVGMNLSYGITVALTCALGAAFLIRNRKELKGILLDRRILLLVFVTLVHAVPTFWKQDWQLMHITLLFGIYVAVFLSYFLTVEDIAKYFVTFITVLAVYSLLATYLLRIPADAGVLRVPTFINAGNREFYNFGLAFPSIVEVSKRNFGIFREPGVYQFFLIVALFLVNYTLTWKKQWQLLAVNAILAVTMLTTFSTNGVIQLFLLAFVLFFDKKLYKDKRALAAVAVMAAGVLAVVAYSFLQKNALYETMYEMVVKLFSNTGSMEARTEAIRVDLEIFLQHPLVGEKIATVMAATDHNTTSTMLLYTFYGIVGGTLNVAAWLFFIWNRERKLWVNLMLVLILFMAFNTQNLTWNNMFWLFPMMALAERGLPLLDKGSRKG